MSIGNRGEPDARRRARPVRRTAEGNGTGGIRSPRPLSILHLSYDCHAADLLYEIVNRRYEQKSIVVTTNRAFKDWNLIFPNATCIVSLLDRLTHHAEVTAIQGDSYRRRESERETAERRKKA